MLPRLNATCRAVVRGLPVACLVVSATIACAEPSGAGGNTVAPVSAAGQRIHIDPKTGARTQQLPADAAAAAASDPALSTSHAGLVEKAAPGGGTMIDLQGRFRSAAEATVGPDGTAKVNCHSPGAHGGGE